MYEEMNLTRDQFKDLLVKMYRIERKSINNIAQELNRHPYNILEWMKKLGIKRRESHGAATEAIQKKIIDPVLTQEQCDIITGLLLGDATITFNRKRPDTVSKIQLDCKFEYVPKRIAQRLEPIRSNLNSFIIDGIYGKGNTYYRFETRGYPFLKKLERKWYKHSFPRKKVVPKDIELTPTVLYYLYIGDGCLYKYMATGKLYYGISLAVQGFPKNSIKYLCKKLKDLGFDFHIEKELRLDRKDQIPKFLEYIGPCKDPEYQYKWNMSFTTLPKKGGA